MYWKYIYLRLFFYISLKYMTVFLKKIYFNVLLNEILVNYQRKKKLIAIIWTFVNAVIL